MKKEKEISRLNELRNHYSEDFIDDIIIIANDRVKAMDANKYDEIENKYQAELKDWESKEKQRKNDYEKECQEIRDNWPKLQEKIKEAWDEKKRVEENNKRVTDEYNQAKSSYENELHRLNDQVASHRYEITKLTGIFKRKQCEEINSKISALESRISMLKVPQMSDFGAIMTVSKENATITNKYNLSYINEPLCQTADYLR